MRGQIAIANAHRAYSRYLERFAGERWQALEVAGARPQRPLWASTGMKDPAYSDVLYVEGLIAPGVVNTMAEKALRAFADHGEVGGALNSDRSAAERVLHRAGEAGLELPRIASELEREGVESFCASYRDLLDSIASKLAALPPEKAAGPH